jgi:hypothetical protein
MHHEADAGKHAPGKAPAPVGAACGANEGRDATPQTGGTGAVPSLALLGRHSGRPSIKLFTGPG